VASTHRRSFSTIIYSVLLIGTACGEGGGRSTPAASATVESIPAVVATDAAPIPQSTLPSTSVAPPTTSPVTMSPVTMSPIAARIVDLEPATYEPETQATPVAAPTLVSIPEIGVVDASIVPVGVLPDGRFEVPEARLVGWYRFGPTPAEDGVTVLAAHLNFDGVNGAFRRLDDVEIDDQVVVTSSDGQTRTYRVTERRLIDKTQLPPDEIWARTGASRLVLVTCGGRYDATRRGYDDNVVVFAEPI
jgi:LPXTG-site transpeptidase (sortase) family protein